MVTVFVDEATEERPVPPAIVTVSLSSIVWLVPESPARVKVYDAAVIAEST
jgi:hypothetical protein